jgi:hypothetical protein
MHSLINTLQSLAQSNSQGGSPAVTKTIAENIFRDLKSVGLRDKDIVAVSSELLNRLTLDIQARVQQEVSEAARLHS